MSYRLTKGWFQVAFEGDIIAEVTPLCLGTRRLMLLRMPDGFRAFDAHCPHRGANLALGGRVTNDVIQCPFHHFKIRLGCQQKSPGEFAVREFPVLCAGGMIFVRLSDEHDNGWPGYLEAIVRDCHIINGFEMSIRAPAALIIENAFDRLHFHAVHGIRTEAFNVHSGSAGELVVESRFFVPNGDGKGLTAAPYRAVVVSPALAMVELRGAVPYTVITGATDAGDGNCTVRLTLALPRSHFPDGPTRAFYDPLLAHSRRGLEEDRVIWENISPIAKPAWTNEDHASFVYGQFCENFADA
jgi:nitrite reductase/ring-hydroxylating ferredoxin subunit